MKRKYSNIEFYSYSLGTLAATREETEAEAVEPDRIYDKPGTCSDRGRGGESS